MARSKKQEPIVAKERTNRERSFHFEFKNATQKIAWTTFQQHDIMFLNGPAGCGKAQPLHSLVYTPEGPKKMGEINLGDMVCTPDGKTAEVVGVYPQGEKKVFKIVFNTNDYVECCEDHLWKIDFVKNNISSSEIVDTKFLIDYYSQENMEYGKLALPLTQAVSFEKKNLSLDPYLLGVLVANSKYVKDDLLIFTKDFHVIEKLFASLKDGYSFKKNKEDNYSLIQTQGDLSCNYYLGSLKEMGLLNVDGSKKFIPHDYLHSSKDDRWELLNGLMDVGGVIGKKAKKVYFSSISFCLAKNVKYLVESLGGVAFITSRKLSCGKLKYNVHICLSGDNQVFGSERKQNYMKLAVNNRPTRTIDKIVEIGVVPAQCIAVDSKDHLYVTDNFVVTHNTILSVGFAINEILAQRKDKIIITRPIVEAGENLGFLPGMLEEKTYPYMVPIYDCIEFFLGKDSSQHKMVQNAVEIAPLAYLRGRNLTNAVCILDEAQNATYSQLKLFVTRLAENTKMIINGDPSQSDLPVGQQGFVEFMNKIATVQGVGLVSFKSDSIVRHPLVAKILEKV